MVPTGVIPPVDKTNTHQRGYKYRLYPTPVQEEILRGWQETHRRVWNELIGPYAEAIQQGVQRKKTNAECMAEAVAKGITGDDALKAAVRELKLADGARFKQDVLNLFKSKGWTAGARLVSERNILRKKRAGSPFCAQIPFSVMDEIVQAHVKAWDSYLAGITKMPCFKAKHESMSSVRTRLAASFKIHDHHVELSMFELNGERTKIRFHKHRPLPTEPTRVCITSQGRRWFVVFGVKVLSIPLDPDRPAVGIDCGVVNLLTDSTSRSVPGIRTSERLDARERWLQRRLAKKKKGSGHWHKINDQINRLRRHKADVRADVLHKESLHYARTYSTVVLEDLKVKNMTKTAKGTKEAPGKNVAQKSGLNRAILSQGWGMFGDMLRYKIAQRHGNLVHVQPNGTSQTCFKCGHVSALNRTTQAEFKCVNCGYEVNADVNAAQNILARAVPGSTHVVEKKAPRKLHTVTGRKKPRTTLSVGETSQNAAVGRTVKLPVEDGETAPPDETGTTCPSTTVSRTLRSSMNGTLPTPAIVILDMLENVTESPSENTDLQNGPAE